MSDYVNTRDLMPGSTDQERALQTLDKLISDELTELVEDGVKQTRQYCFYYRPNIQSINLPKLQRISAKDTFYSLSNLKNLKIDQVRSLATDGIRACPKLYHLKLYDLTTFYISALGSSDNYERTGPYILEINCNEDLTLTINNYTKSMNLKHVIIHNPIQAIASYPNFLQSEPFGYYNEGCIYVPANLVNTYKNATNWSAYADYIFPIQIGQDGEVVLKEGDTITDTWQQILTAEDNGTYITKYHIGDTKTLTINEQDVQMEIVAFDTDLLENGNTAKITWMCKLIPAIAMQFFPKSGSQTTSIPDWRSSLVYTYMNDTIYNSLDSTIKLAIQPVKKYFIDSTNTEQFSYEKLWLPSAQELNVTGYETSGTTYSCFDTNNTRFKHLDKDYITSCSWYTRSLTGNKTVLVINGSPHSIRPYTDSNANTSYYVVFGFCT